MIQESYDGSCSLYLIPTPIGNLDDITFRSLELLKFVDVILCEDTRVTGSLLSRFEIKKRLISCHEYNESKVGSYVVSLLQSGKNVGLVTDQGTPIISDPGFLVAKFVIAAGYNVIGLPGATAFVPALISSGIAPSPFLFYGFLNAKKSKQLKELENIKSYPFTIIFYEAPHRIKTTLQNMLDVLGDRYISLSREISKIHESNIRGQISEVLLSIDNIRGEIVLVVSGNDKNEDFSMISIVEHVELYKNDGLSEMDSIKRVSKERGLPKSVVYKEYISRR